MLEKLIGAQILTVNNDSIEVELGEKSYVLEILTDDGDCCGYTNFTTKILYSENDIRNPIITNVSKEYVDSEIVEEISIITFYGESKPLATIESEAGSGSGWHYGACVTLRCKALNIDEELASW